LQGEKLKNNVVGAKGRPLTREFEGLIGEGRAGENQGLRPEVILMKTMPRIEGIAFL